MKISICVLTTFFCLAVLGCSGEKPRNEPVQEPLAISHEDRESIRSVLKELQSLAGLSDKTFEILGQEAKSLLTGEKKDLDLAGLADKTKNELRAAVTTIASKPLPEGLPAGIQQNLQEAKEGLIKAGQLKSESLEIMKRLLEEKSPAIFLEYRSKMAAAVKELNEAMAKLKVVQTAAGI